MKTDGVLDVAIVGGGPSGLATAIECQRAGLSYEVIEKGGLVDAIRRFPINMVFFTTPELLEIGGLPLVCPPREAVALRSARLLPEGRPSATTYIRGFSRRSCESRATVGRMGTSSRST